MATAVPATSKPGRSRFFGAIAEEFRDVYSFWGADWLGIGAARREPAAVVNALLYTFSYSLLTSASFGFLYAEDTGDAWGVVVSFASAGLTGIFMALVGGQPVVLYGQTGPVVLLYYYVYQIAHTLKIPFAPWVAWIGVWSFMMHTLLAAFGTCDYKDRVTRFTSEIFEVLVASDYITSAVLGPGFLGAWSLTAYDCHNDRPLCSVNGLWNLVLGLAFYATSMRFGGLQRRCRWSSATLIRYVSQFGALVSLVLYTLISYIPQWVGAPGWPGSGVPNRVTVPQVWGRPAGHDFLAFMKMGEVPGWAVAAALIPALLLTVLFYVDQNLSSMAAVKGFWGRLRSPDAFNLDFFLLGITVLVTGLLGLPASSGLIPQNPMHTRALSLRRVVTKEAEAEDLDVEAEAEEAGEVGSQSGIAARVVESESEPAAAGPTPAHAEEVHVVEQRLSSLLHSIFLLVVGFFLMPVVGWIPTGVLWGAFLLLASEAYHSEFVQRVLLSLTTPNMRTRKDNWRNLGHLDPVPYSVVVRFTMVQLALWLVLYVVAVLLKIVAPISAGNTWVVVGATFPVLVCLCAIPVRTTFLPKCFTSSHLQILDEDGSNTGGAACEEKSTTEEEEDDDEEDEDDVDDSSEID